MSMTVDVTTDLASTSLPPGVSDGLTFLDAPGAAAACVRGVDWAATPLGAVETWPQSLRTVVGLMLRSRNPMFLYWGPEFVVLYNDAYLPSFGEGKHPKAMGQRGRDCWPEIWPIICPDIENAVLNGQSTWHEDQLVPIHRNGRIEAVYWTYGYAPVIDETGGVGGALVVVTETTVRVVAERRLRAARLLTERTGVVTDTATLREAVADVFRTMSSDVTFMLSYLHEANELRLVASSGFTAEELAKVEPFVLEQLERSEAWVPADTKDLNGGSASPQRLTLPELSRPDALAEAFFTPLRTAGEIGRPSGFVVFGINAAQSFDGAYRTHLEELGETLSLAHSRESLRASQKQIQMRLVLADRMASIGTLAAGAAHEINNPLTYVTANLDVVLEEIRELAGGSTSGRLRELEEMVREARDGAERVRKIVRGLKTFSRTDEEQRAVLELRPVLELSINMAFNEIRHRARLVKDYGETPNVVGDEARLGQVFINLLVNAAQAIPAGHADKHEIRVVTSTDDAGRAVVEIRDTGPGIAADVMKHIFEPFFTTKAVGGGTGLGLSICHNLVTSMGGELTVKSALGHGTTFRVVLPAVAGAPRPVTTTVGPVAETKSETRRSAILVVDDEPAIGTILGRVLRDHQVTIVSSAAEALEALTAAGGHFDAIVSDLMMPHMSGMELYDEVARRFPAVVDRVVFLTGGAFTPAAKAFLARVPNERIEKPFSLTQVRALIEKTALR